MVRFRRPGRHVSGRGVRGAGAGVGQLRPGRRAAHRRAARLRDPAVRAARRLPDRDGAQGPARVAHRVRLRPVLTATWHCGPVTTARAVLVLNGPNLNLLGTREPGVYGAATLDDVHELCRAEARRWGLDVDARQTNHEGVLVDWLQEAGRAHAAGEIVGAVLNAGAYTHPAVAPRGALSGTGPPPPQGHRSNGHARGAFRPPPP